MPHPREPASPFCYFDSSPEVIRLMVVLYVRFPLFAGEVRLQRVSRMRTFAIGRWYLDEMYVKLNGGMAHPWRAVDHEGEILESYVTKTRDKRAALAFMKKALKRHGPKTGHSLKLR